MLKQSFANFTARLQTFIDRSKTASESSDREFDELALQLFELQRAHDEPYRRFCEARGVKPAKVQDIPFVPTTSFKEFEFSCLSPEERTAVFHSSGTTEQRLSRHFHNRGSLSIYEDSLWPWFARHLLPEKMATPPTLVMLTPEHAKVPNSSLVHMFHAICERLAGISSIFLGEVRGDGWNLNEAATLRFFTQTRFHSPVLLMGTAFNFVQLFDLFSRHQVRPALPAGSRILETGGYKGRTRTIPKAELYRALSETFAVPPEFIVSEYGMSELSSQAYDGVAGVSRDDRVFEFPPWARATIIDPETGNPAKLGEPGLLRILDLANVFSVAAIQTEDLAIARGRGFELIGRATAAEPRGCSLMTNSFS